MLPNYYDLLLIYGNEIGDGFNCDLQQNKNPEDDISESKAGELQLAIFTKLRFLCLTFTVLRYNRLLRNTLMKGPLRL
jgi:hypothetical protein